MKRLLKSLFQTGDPDPLAPIRDALIAAQIDARPGPWTHVLTTAINGLTAVGFDRRNETLLVTSETGQSVLDATTGTRLYRNRADDGMDSTTLKAARLDHPAIERIDMAGLAGGALRQTSPDGWSVDMLSPDWPETCCILHPPRASIYHLKPGWSSGIKNADFHLMGRPRERICAFGFSWTGRTLVLATTSELRIWARPAPLHLV